MVIRFQLNEDDVLAYFRHREKTRPPRPLDRTLMKNITVGLGIYVALLFWLGDWIHACMILGLAGLFYRFRRQLGEGFSQWGLQEKARSMDPLLKGVTTVTLDEFRLHHTSKGHDDTWDFRDIIRIVKYPEGMAIEHKSKQTVIIPTARLPLQEAIDFTAHLRKFVMPRVFTEET